MNHPLSDFIFKSLDSETIQTHLLHNNGSIRLHDQTYYCKSTVLNVYYTYHAYHLQSLDGDEEIVLLIADIITACYISSANLFFWSSYTHDFLLVARAQIEDTVRKIPDWTCGRLTPPHKMSLPPDITCCLVSGTQQHLAHYLWNHLGAMWRLSRCLSDNTAEKPVIIASNSEKYGDITELFPSLNLTRLDAEYDTSRPVFVKATCIEPYSLGPIGSGLRESILRVNKTNFSSLTSSNDNRNISDCITICLALRGGVRRASNRREIISEIALQARKLKAKYKISVVLAIYLTIQFPGLPASCSTNELAAEIVDALSDSCNSDAFCSVLFIDNMPLNNALGILDGASFYIAEWGASLSILSWILGLPGIWLCPPSVRDNAINASSRVFGCGDISISRCFGDYLGEVIPPSIVIPDSREDQTKATGDISWHSHAVDYTVDLKSFAVAFEYFAERSI